MGSRKKVCYPIPRANHSTGAVAVGCLGHLVEVGEGGLQALHHGAHPPQRRALEGLAAVQRVAWWPVVLVVECVVGGVGLRLMEPSSPVSYNTRERKKEPLVTSRHVTCPVVWLAWLVRTVLEQAHVVAGDRLNEVLGRVDPPDG